MRGHRFLIRSHQPWHLWQWYIFRLMDLSDWCILYSIEEYLKFTITIDRVTFDMCIHQRLFLVRLCHHQTIKFPANHLSEAILVNLVLIVKWLTIMSLKGLFLLFMCPDHHHSIITPHKLELFTFQIPHYSFKDFWYGTVIRVKNVAFTSGTGSFLASQK